MIKFICSKLYCGIVRKEKEMSCFMSYTNKKGSIRQRKNGTFELRISINGISKSFYGRTEAEVRRKHRLYMLEQSEKERKALRNESSSRTVSEFVSYYLVTYKYGAVAPSTYDRLEGTFNNHIKNSLLGFKQISDVTTDDIQELINLKKSCLSLSSLKKIKEVLQPCFEYAVRKKLIEKNPVLDVVLPTKQKQKLKASILDEHIYTDHEVTQIALAASPIYFAENSRRYRYAPMYVFLLNTGLRIGECLALTYSDVDFERGIITINKSVQVSYERDEFMNRLSKKQKIGNTKTSCGTRTLPLNAAAIEAIEEMRTRAQVLGIKSDLIFSNYSGGLLNIRSVQKTFSEICKEFGIVPRGLHALRHTFGSILIRNHVDIKVVSELLGHTDIMFTYNRYIHVIMQQKAEAIDLIDVVKIRKPDNNMTDNID